MSNFRQQLFHQFASQGLATSIDAFKTQYQPKKENRFNLDGITYEIGPARLDGDSITFEISSKIPQDELDDREDFASYFSAIQDFLKQDAKQPAAIDMENIVQEVGGDETKVVAAVLLFRALTFLPPVFIGAVVAFTWRRHERQVAPT